MTETEAPTYRGVLLDLDGTLVDSNHAHAQVAEDLSSTFADPRAQLALLLDPEE